jgi:peptide/nickel transport system ATP-binding protein
VMYAGRAVEHGPAEQLFEEPEHPYTWGLLASMPRFDRPRSARLNPIPGTPPSLINVPNGCPFHPRCAYEPQTGGLGRTERPDLLPVTGGTPRPGTGSGHLVACHLPPGRRRELFEQEIRPKL